MTAWYNIFYLLNRVPLSSPSSTEKQQQFPLEIDANFLRVSCMFFFPVGK